MTTRKLPLTLLLMMVIVSTVSFLPVQETGALTELKYDDGSAEGNGNGLTGDMQGVRFSLPSGVIKAKILTARIYIDADPASFILHIFGSDSSTELLTPPPTVTPSGTGWFDVDVSAKGIVASGDFIVAIEWNNRNAAPKYGIDENPPFGLRSIQKPVGSPDWGYPQEDENYMIRAVIDPNMAPVGGVVLPTSKLEVAAPFAALAGLVVAVSAVVAVKKRRQ